MMEDRSRPVWPFSMPAGNLAYTGTELPQVGKLGLTHGAVGFSSRHNGWEEGLTRWN